MRTLTRTLVALIVLSGPAAAEEGKVIPLSPELKKELALLGDGVVGRAVPAHPIPDATRLMNVEGGTSEFKVVSGKHAGKTQVESYHPLAGKGAGESWERKVGDEYLEYIRFGADGGWTKTAELAVEFGYRSTFSPGIHEARGFAPGESVEIDSTLEVSSQEDPSKIKYTGKMHATVTYEGAYQVHTPAGSFDAALIKTAAKIHVGPAKVEDTQYTFYAEGVGKVAEIEAQRVSAVLIYHSHSKTAKVLTKAPAH